MAEIAGQLLPVGGVIKNSLVHGIFFLFFLGLFFLFFLCLFFLNCLGIFFLSLLLLVPLTLLTFWETRIYYGYQGLSPFPPAFLFRLLNLLLELGKPVQSLIPVVIAEILMY